MVLHARSESLQRRSLKVMGKTRHVKEIHTCSFTGWLMRVKHQRQILKEFREETSLEIKEMKRGRISTKL